MRTKPIKRINERFKAVTIIELVIAAAAGVIIMLAAGMVLVGGHHAWEKTFDLTHLQIKDQADRLVLTFSSMGRRSNRTNYTMYNGAGSGFIRALPTPDSQEEIVMADAVEFRYWDVELDESDTHQLFDPDKKATAYAFFYLDGDKLKVDYGPYPPGAVPGGAGTKNGSGVRTQILAENVSLLPGIKAFSHTTQGEVGMGSVRVHVQINDPQAGRKIQPMTTVLLRNQWP